MKALTISQPFASLIADGDKWVENRTWGTNYRGLLAIHAGQGTQYLSRSELAKYTSGVIAVATLFACMPFDSILQLGRSTPIQASFLTIGDVLDHEHTNGPWCWILRDVRKLQPIEIGGAQGLWEWEEPDLARVTATIVRDSRKFSSSCSGHDPCA
jgi:hypothetical protein